ncbi:O-antigen ligase family protein [Pseudomonas sp. FYR_11]|uniref:O-antigen ligase family protein n=1 Tax=Pseudomonas TaxID=286 RepID=UPI00370BE7DC
MQLGDFSLRVAGLILLLSLVFPTSFTAFKTVALLLPLSCLLLGGDGVGKVDSRLFWAALMFSFIGLGWSFYGTVQDNPGALRVLTVMVVYPTLFTILAMLYQGNSHGLERLLVASGLLIVLLDLGFVLGEIVLPGNPLSASLRALYGNEAVVDYGSGYLKFTLPNVSSVIFLLSFMLCRVICQRFSLLGGVTLLGLVLVVLFSGRRVILITAVLGPVIAYCLSWGAPGGRGSALFKLSLFFCGGVALAIFVYSLWPDYIYERVSSIFDFAADASNSERAIQFDSLIDGIVVNPFWGSGAGAVASYVRSEEMPWAYELFYVSLILQYGFFGFSLYAAGVMFLIVFLAREVRRNGRESFEFYYLCGLISFLLATATNPYLAKFDYMWVLFVPVALLNYRLVADASKDLVNGH